MPAEEEDVDDAPPPVDVLDVGDGEDEGAPGMPALPLDPPERLVEPADPLEPLDDELLGEFGDDEPPPAEFVLQPPTISTAPRSGARIVNDVTCA